MADGIEQKVDDVKTGKEIIKSIGKKRKFSKEEKKSLKGKKAKVSVRRKPGFDKELYDETSYFVRNGLRYVIPYYFTFTSHCKGRWLGRKILDVYREEFRSEPLEYYEKAIKSGKITVNGELATFETILKDNVVICHKVHRHEPPVSSEAIQIVASNEDVVVINKPSSIPVHPCGRYRHNSIVFLLGKEHGLTNLFTVHRIDRLTSGILMFARTLKKAQELEGQVRERLIDKEYVCRVQGDFPSESLECCQPILVVSHKVGVCRVSPDGKHCKTIFTKLYGDGYSSVVKCKPFTGRMHQIRVHLQWLGYPIIDDPIYNSPMWGDTRGKGGITDDEALKVVRSLAESSATIINTEKTSLENTSNPSNGTNDCNANPNDKISEVHQDYTQVSPTTIKNFSQFTSVKDPDCSECKLTRRDPTPAELTMCLHALSYKGPDWEYKTDMPSWAAQNWTGE